MVKYKVWMKSISLTAVLLAVPALPSSAAPMANTIIKSEDIETSETGARAKGVLPNTALLPLTIRVSGDYITLGDLFDTAPADLKDKAVLASPAEGNTLTLSAFQIKNLADQNSISYKMDYTQPTVKVQRVKTPLKSDQALPPLTVTLVRNPVVTTNHIYMGDIFKGYYSDTNVIIAEAPAPGKRLSLSMADIQSLAGLHGLTIKKTEPIKFINISRKGQAIPVSQLETIIKKELHDFGYQKVSGVTIFTLPATLYIPSNGNISDIYVADLSIIAANRFEADLIVPTGKPVPRSLTIKGSFNSYTGFEAQQVAASLKVDDINIRQGQNNVSEPVSFFDIKAEVKTEKQTIVAAGGQKLPYSLSPEAEAIQEPVPEIPELEIPEPEVLTVRLKSPVIVEGQSITLGEMFDFIPDDQAGERILAAPLPGKSINLSTVTVQRIAEDFGFKIDIPRHINQIVVHREGTRVTKDDFLDVISSRLISEGIDDRFKVDILFSGRDYYVPVTSDMGDMIVESLTISPKQDRFTVVIQVPSGTYQPHRARFNGRLLEMRNVPVLARSLTPGEEIALRDIRYKSVPLNRVSRGSIFDANQLVGMTVRRSISAGSLLKNADVVRPIVIKKGTPITITLVAGSMKLAAAGLALENGSIGDLVKIENLQSGKVIDAKVIGLGQVEAIFLSKDQFAKAQFAKAQFASPQLSRASGDLNASR